MKTKSTFAGSLFFGFFISIALPVSAADSDASKRRIQLLELSQAGETAIPLLFQSLEDKNGAVRRTAIRLLSSLGAPALASLKKALSSPDYVIRRAALFAICDLEKAAALLEIEQAQKDKEPLVRLAATEILTRLEPRTEAISKLLSVAQEDAVPEIRERASEALWPFYKRTILLSQRKDWDHVIKLVQKIALQEKGWRFKTDPLRSGHLEKWFEPAYDDAKWAEIEIGRAWETLGHTYDGVAWYRGKFNLPAMPKHNAVELHFGAVDESTWVWLNGEYVGQHDAGPHGWDKPFRLDATKQVRWDGENQITVRVLDTKFAGGIWKPVSLEILE
ncbi:MAG: HEAT repeat domain-containing protein [Planctomycetota bacterium]|nr:HEAT repeat domain-containing protein [Planctomycetota bacterium]